MLHSRHNAGLIPQQILVTQEVRARSLHPGALLLVEDVASLLQLLVHLGQMIEREEFPPSENGAQLRSRQS